MHVTEFQVLRCMHEGESCGSMALNNPGFFHTPSCYFLFSLGVRRPGAWSHSQVTIGACDCAFLRTARPDDTIHQTTPLCRLVQCDWKQASSTAHFRSLVTAHHIIQSFSFCFQKYTFATRFQRHVSRETGGRFDTTLFISICRRSPSPPQHLHKHS